LGYRGDMVRKTPSHTSPMSPAAPPRFPIFAWVVGLLLVGLMSTLFARSLADVREASAQARHRFAAPNFEASATHAAAVPDFALTDRFGQEVRLSRFASLDYLLVHIWTPDCDTCLAELPALAELDHQLSQEGRAALLTIAVADNWERVAPALSQGADLRVFLDPEDRVAKGIFGAQQYPEMFVLDKQRRIRARFDGPRPWNTVSVRQFLAQCAQN